jgi:hypothetical protein
MADNTVLKDGIGNSFTLRAKDVTQIQDGSLRRSMTMATLFPVEFGTTGGSFHKAAKSGVMAAGLVAASPIFSFWFQSGVLFGLVRRVRLQAWTTATPFAAGLATFDFFIARNFTNPLTGGTTALAGGRMRGSFPIPNAIIEIAATAALAGGSYALEQSPAESVTVTPGTVAQTLFSPAPLRLFETLQGEMPLLFVQGEGFLIQATVPATGTWGFSVTTEWDEVPLYSAGF